MKHCSIRAEGFTASQEVTTRYYYTTSSPSPLPFLLNSLSSDHSPVSVSFSIEITQPSLPNYPIPTRILFSQIRFQLEKLNPKSDNFILSFESPILSRSKGSSPVPAVSRRKKKGRERGGGGREVGQHFSSSFSSPLFSFTHLLFFFS
jgi:hypothetical protein